MKGTVIAPIPGLSLYYEVEGQGQPLVFIGPAFGQAGLRSFPELAKRFSIIKPDLQGHGRTADVLDRPMSLEQNAEDIVALLAHLGIDRADFVGESYGGATAVLLALRHPTLVRRVVSIGGTFGPPEEAHNPEMLRFSQPPTADSASTSFQKERYLEVAPHPEYWPTFWGKVVSLVWNGLTAEELGAVQAPVLFIVGDRDFVRLEHAVDTYRKVPNAELAVIPDAGHFMLFSEPRRVEAVIQHFLEKPDVRPPVGNAEQGYHPGRTR